MTEYDIDVLEYVTNVRDAIDRFPKIFEANEANLRDIQRELNDYEHYMEAVDLNVFDGFNTYKEYQRLRRERRKFSNQYEKLKHLKSIFADLAKNNTIGKLDNSIGLVRKQVEAEENWHYNCRVRKEFENKINGVRTG